MNSDHESLHDASEHDNNDLVTDVLSLIAEYGFVAKNEDDIEAKVQIALDMLLANEFDHEDGDWEPATEDMETSSDEVESEEEEE